MKEEIEESGLPLMLRAKDVAKYFSVGLSTVWLYAKQNKLKAIKSTNGCTRFNTKQVVEFFNGK